MTTEEREALCKKIEAAMTVIEMPVWFITPPMPFEYTGGKDIDYTITADQILNVHEYGTKEGYYIPFDLHSTVWKLMDEYGSLVFDFCCEELGHETVLELSRAHDFVSWPDIMGFYLRLSLGVYVDEVMNEALKENNL